MSQPSSQLSAVLISLMKGVLNRDQDAGLWQSLVVLQARVRDHVAVLGLDLILDEAEGHAYLRQRPPTEGEAATPRLVARRRLGYAVSLLIVLLRKKLVEFDAASGETRLILSRDEIIELVRLFLPGTANEARLVDQVDSRITKVVEMGFLRRLRGEENQFEVCRILKAFVDAQWLSEFDARLTEYRDHAAGSPSEAQAGA